MPLGIVADFIGSEARCGIAGRRSFFVAGYRRRGRRPLIAMFLVAHYNTRRVGWHKPLCKVVM